MYQIPYFKKLSKEILISITMLFILLGCSSNQKATSVLATSATIIGVDISQQPTSSYPTATLGYKRAEFAYVPTNKASSPNLSYDKGASETADVIMELRYAGIFSMGENSGIYQRLAVGPNAVMSSGAKSLFSRSFNENLSEKIENEIKDQNQKVNKIVEELEGEDGKIKANERDKLLENAKLEDSVKNYLKSANTVIEFKEKLEFLDGVINPLYEKLPN